MRANTLGTCSIYNCPLASGQPICTSCLSVHQCQSCHNCLPTGLENRRPLLAVATRADTIDHVLCSSLSQHVHGGPLPTTLQGLTASASGPALSNSLNTMRHAAAGPHLLPQQLHCSSSAARAAPHSHSLAMHENSCTLTSCCGVRLTPPAALGPIFASGQNPSSLVCMCMHHESTALPLGPTWCGIQLAPACCPRA